MAVITPFSSSARPVLRVLLVEDSPSDAHLLIQQLRSAGFEPQLDRVETDAAFLALLRADLDVILSDYTLPKFSAPVALRLLQQSGLDVPFIVVSGSIEEDAAVTCMKNGADDYLLKDRLARLGEAIRQAMEERRLRMEKRRAHEALRHAYRELDRHARNLRELQRSSAQSLALLETLLLHAPIGIALISPDLRFLRLNAEMASINGRPLDAHLGAPLKDMAPALWPTLEPICRRVIDHGESVRDSELTQWDPACPGAARHLLASYYPVRVDPQKPCVGLLCLDITARKREEQEIARARDAAESANRAKDEFLAKLSHELRTPLNPVLMLASEWEHAAELSNDLRGDFTKIRENAEMEARLIDDLLDLSRIESGRLSLCMETLDVHDALKKALSVVRSEWEAKEIRLTLELNARQTLVQGDPVHLQQVFWNVLRNAVKFTPRGGAIVVRSLSRPGRVLLEISDTGIGMSERDLTRAFEPFFQGNPAADQKTEHGFGGLGLGLSISKSVVERHGGSISALSAGPGQGATFTIELPLSASQFVQPEQALAAPDAPYALQCGWRILLVEDHEPTRGILGRLLRRRGHTVVEAGRLSGAREEMERGGFDLILCDLGLPDGSGQDFLGELRAAGDQTRAIALSGYGMDSDIRRSLAAGFCSHLTKPVDMEALERAMSAAIGPIGPMGQSVPSQASPSAAATAPSSQPEDSSVEGSFH
jgi:signal transduction histidine kinase/CheY-like chemotaxis protein